MSSNTVGSLPPTSPPFSSLSDRADIGFPPKTNYIILSSESRLNQKSHLVVYSQYLFFSFLFFFSFSGLGKCD